jgi:hypothetical protein
MCTATVYGYRPIPNNYPNSAGTYADYDYTSSYAVLPAQMGGNGTIQVARTASPGYVDVAEATVSATNTGDGPLTYKSMINGTAGGAYASNFLTIDGTGIGGAEILPGSTLSIERVIERFQVGGSGRDMGATAAHEWDVTGKIDLLFVDNTWVKAVQRKSNVGLNFKFAGPAIGTTGLNYGMEFYIPRMNLLDGGVEIPATAMLTGGTFQGKKDLAGISGVSALNASVQIILTNTTDNSTFGGTAGSTGAAGGLGGWNNS